MQDHDHGFHHDLPRLLARRKVLLGLGGALGLAATGASAQTLACFPTAAETAGPFPANGTPSRWFGSPLNVLTENGVIRQDIRTSFAGMTPVAEGAKFNLELELVNANTGCSPMEGLALYAWQCDAAGRYSLYEDEDRNYLRGVGISDANGKVRLTTIFPGCYDGRWPHIHFEIFASADDAVSGAQALLTSQLALPEVDCVQTYAQHAGYEISAKNLKRQSFETDMIWRNNSAAQKQQIMLRLTGNASTGYAGTCQIGLDA